MDQPKGRLTVPAVGLYKQRNPFARLHDPYRLVHGLYVVAADRSVLGGPIGQESAVDHPLDTVDDLLRLLEQHGRLLDAALAAARARVGCSFNGSSAFHR